MKTDLVLLKDVTEFLEEQGFKLGFRTLGLPPTTA